ncbi:unnamed protein product [Nesidiocoris tenuis]|uniref:Uncharacterized protein n=1 Tax=Nesidiocoris tenuis TaxID=355587 RepID=A0A6H5H0K3_9HEMI|nr:unnamed protein product [Nesidiocoris tenuis]CAB0009022.1 unnamed protein product [Nesidiocoris tenuis]
MHFSDVLEELRDHCTLYGEPDPLTKRYGHGLGCQRHSTTSDGILYNMDIIYVRRIILRKMIQKNSCISPAQGYPGMYLQLPVISFGFQFRGLAGTHVPQVVRLLRVRTVNLRRPRRSMRYSGDKEGLRTKSRPTAGEV